MPETPRPRSLSLVLRAALAECSTDKAGAAVGVNGSAVRKWRLGLDKPTPAKLAALLDVCGAPTDLQIEAWMALGVPAHVLVTP